MSRRSRSLLFAAIAVALAAAVWLDRTTPVHRRGRHDDFARYHGKVFTVVKVIDGDTLDIDVPDGRGSSTRVRLWGVDTPEHDAYFGPQAADFTRKLAQGKKITIHLDQDNRTRGKYGRLLAYVQLPDGAFLNELLLTEGYAYADVRFRHSFYNRYRQLESRARRNRTGLWKHVTRDRLPACLRRERPDLLAK